MEQRSIIQKIKRVDIDPFDKAKRYYAILSAIAGSDLTERELQLIAFTAIKGNISYKDYRQEFVDKYKSSQATLNNIISKLKKTKILVKDSDKIKVNPQYLIDFNIPLVLQISLQNG
jgi:hypothetical protein